MQDALDILKHKPSWAVVVAQLVKRSLPTPEVRGSNPVIGKKFYRTFVYRLSIVLKDEKRKKRPVMTQIEKKHEPAQNFESEFKLQ